MQATASNEASSAASLYSATSRLEKAFTISGFPAVAVEAVGAGCRVVCAAAAGKAKGGTPASAATTTFMAASISKTVLSVLCLRCVEAGELDLDAGVNVALAAAGLVVANPKAGPGADPITPRQLLTHSPGLRDDEESLSTSHPGHPCPAATFMTTP